MLAKFLLPALFAAGCSAAAYADQPSVPPQTPGAQIALGIAPAKSRAPYDVQVMRENGESLPTFAQRDRFYVQGNAGERYVLRITNPTPNRVEAVVSVDGLDVIDGENGDLRKRGYVVPAYGETRIEGFRTSQSDVATFRFSGVGDSYAGMKGKARNVGVIAVAIFEEAAPPPEQQIIVGDASRTRPAKDKRDYDYTDDLDEEAPAGVTARAPAPSPTRRYEGAAKADRRAPAEAPPPPPASPVTGSAGGYGRATAAPHAAKKAGNWDDGDGADSAADMRLESNGARPARERAGLGTEFGENRYSAASYTRFQRAPGRPIAIAELRYNNTAGLAALGINVEPLPDEGEIMTRETADPFPGDRFAKPVD